MTLNIEITPREEEWLAAKSAEQGLPAAEIIKQLIDVQLQSAPMDLAQMDRPELDATKALFAQWAKEDATPGLDVKTLETIAWLDARIEAGRNASPEERRLAEEELAELKRNMNANRAVTGERLVFS